MELHHLKAFVAVAEEGNLTRAAARLHASPPAVSAHIKALEEDLGVGLFRRTPRGMETTEAGLALLAHARTILGGLDALRAEAHAVRGDASGVVRLGLHIAPAQLRVATFSTALARIAPGVVLHTKQSPSWETVDALRSGKLDAGFVYARSTTADIEALHTTILTHIPLRVAGPTAWADKLAHATLPELAAMPWIWVPCECPFCSLLDEVFANAGLEPHIVAMADEEAAMCSLAAGGRGLTVMAEEDAQNALAAGEVALRHEPLATITLALATSAAQSREPALVALRQAVQESWA